MAIDMDTIGVPGLLFPFVTHSIETGIIQADKAEKGGFGLWGKIGEPGKVYPAKPASEGVLLGIAQFTQCHYEYKAGDEVNVVKKGRVWVKVSGEVLANQPAYITPAGAITATASGNEALSGATFKSDASDGKLAELEIA